MTYKIYHIPGVKIGCTKYIQSRIRQQGYIDYEILEEHDDRDVASDREIQLQIEYGYAVGGRYANTVRSHLTKEHQRRGGQNSPLNRKEIQSKGGKIGGKTNRDSGHISRIGKARRGIKQVERTCPHCGKAGGNTMGRWHFDNCKNKK